MIAHNAVPERFGWWYPARASPSRGAVAIALRQSRPTQAPLVRVLTFPTSQHADFTHCDSEPRRLVLTPGAACSSRPTPSSCLDASGRSRRTVLKKSRQSYKHEESGCQCHKDHCGDQPGARLLGLRSPRADHLFRKGLPPSNRTERLRYRLFSHLQRAVHLCRPFSISPRSRPNLI
jgi:hypothetical protein